MSKYCLCTDWNNNIDKINNIFKVAYTHGKSYDGKEYECCPWCGVVLKKGKQSNESN